MKRHILTDRRGVAFRLPPQHFCRHAETRMEWGLWRCGVVATRFEGFKRKWKEGRKEG
ncbi:MAG: hypothetical protein IPK50_22580 [Fibrobacterota bacterium]|nr:MAG: hypothetical protein IPK50_22580 [Fibrobacterota bacterium]